MLGARDKRRAARLARIERRRDILAEPHGFDSDAGGLEAGSHRIDLLADFGQTLRKFGSGLRGNAAVRQAGQTRTVLANDAPARIGKTRVDAQNNARYALRHRKPLSVNPAFQTAP